jgi:hypothetical protein
VQNVFQNINEHMRIIYNLIINFLTVILLPDSPLSFAKILENLVFSKKRSGKAVSVTGRGGP